MPPVLPKIAAATTPMTKPRGPLGKVIVEQRVAGGLRRALADTDAEPGDGEQRKSMGKCPERRCQRPKAKRDSEQPGSQPPVRQPPDRQREQRVEKREYGSVQQTHLGIADGKALLDAGAPEWQ
jgi:hypothetical protein